MKKKPTSKRKSRSYRIGRRVFLRMLAERFPAIAANIDDEDRRSIYMAMGPFAEATRQAIRAGDFETVRQHFRFVDTVLEHAHTEVKSAIAVSYIEHLDLQLDKKNSIRARCLLSARLLAIYRELEQFWLGPEADIEQKKQQ